MGLFRRKKFAGLDLIIDRAQKKLYEKLIEKWSVEIDAYPRCYVLEKEQNRSIEHYEGNGEYSGDLIHSEGNKFFFTAEETQERVNNEQFTTSVKVYFILDLEEIYPVSHDRMDAVVTADIISVLDSVPGFEKTFKIITDYQQVFEGLDYDFDNIQPYYCLQFDLKTMPYSINQKC